MIESLSVFSVQNAARIVRALFEIALRKRWPAMTYRLLNLCKVIDKRLWGWAHPLRQFSVLPPSVLSRMEEKKLTVDKLRDMGKDEIGQSDTRRLCGFVSFRLHHRQLRSNMQFFPLLGNLHYKVCVCVCVYAGHMLHHVNIGLKVKQCVHQIPSILMESSIQPITRTVLRVRLSITPDFRWNDQVTMATISRALHTGISGFSVPYTCSAHSSPHNIFRPTFKIYCIYNLNPFGSHGFNMNKLVNLM